MSKKLELVWEENGSAIPIYDALQGSTIITATPRGMKRVKCKFPRYVVKRYPITHGMLKAVGDAADAARKERVCFSILLTNGGEIGFAAFPEKASV